MSKKGSKCSINGKNYEIEVYNIVKNTKLNGNNFNTQLESELGGCSSRNDIECNMNLVRDVSIEIKKSKTPDWMQCSLKYDNINKKWIGSSKNKIPDSSKKVFEDIISRIILFNGKIPPFMLKDITHQEWIKIKNETINYNDYYINCPNDTIMKLYSEKGCSYIQISEKGLYHLGNDMCNFKVPAFICEQQLRVRTKIHERKNKKGFCKLSVTVSCQPKNIKNLLNSKYSLDNKNKLPKNLVYEDIYLNCKNYREIQISKVETNKLKEKLIETNKEILNTINNNINISHEGTTGISLTSSKTQMELFKLSKKELLIECDKLGITKCKSKRKEEIIRLINTKNENLRNNVNTTNNINISHEGTTGISLTSSKTQMELFKLSKKELLIECDKLGITKCKSKRKEEIIRLINTKNENLRNNVNTTNNNYNSTSKTINTINISPLRYPGGKTRACKIIDEIIIQYFNTSSFDTIISPFFGGGSFEFYLQNKYGIKLIVNDKFTPLYNFWKQVKLNKTLLCEELRKIKSVSKEQFMSYRNTIMNLNDNVLQQSIQYFIINRCSFNGSTLSGGFSEEASNKRFTPSSIDKIEALNFEHIEIYNYDFYDFVNNVTTDKALLFLDPPYYLESKSKLYGNNGDMHENFNHKLLFDLLNTKKNWIVTYNNCEYIRKLYKDYIIIDTNWTYGMNTSKMSSEIIIISK